MKFSVPSVDLLKVFSKTGGVVPSKSTLPILENYLFELSKDTLRVTATDLEISTTDQLKVSGEQDGRIAVPARRLMETVRALPNVAIRFVADVSNNKVLMSTATGEYKLTGESAEEYPTLPSVKDGEMLDVPSEKLSRMITKTIFAVSSDELRPAMMGVLFQIRKKELRTVATDGHRLVRTINKDFSSGGIERDVIIPAKALHVLLKSIESGSLSLGLHDTHASFKFGSTVIISRLIEEKYPNYESVIPQDNDKELTINRDELLNAIKRISLYSNATTRQVRLSLKKNSLAVSAEDVDFGSEANETLPCQYTSEPMEIGFNANYLIDILGHLDAGDCVLMFGSPTRAGIIRPATQSEGEDVLMLVMPVRLNV